MPDTGAPHFIPFADPTDLVRDWPALSEDVAQQVALGLDAAGNAGIGSNVVQAVKTDTFSTSSGSFVDVTGLEVTITPSSATSKVLLLAQISISGQTNQVSASSLRFSGGNSTDYIADTDGSRRTGVVGYGPAFTTSIEAWRIAWPAQMTYLDSPASASAVTYKLQGRSNNTLFVNRAGSDSDSASTRRTASSLIAIEVAP